MTRDSDDATPPPAYVVYGPSTDHQIPSPPTIIAVQPGPAVSEDDKEGRDDAYIREQSR